MVHGTEKVGDIKQSDIETMFNTNVLGLIQLTQLIVTGKLLPLFSSCVCSQLQSQASRLRTRDSEF